MSEDLLSELIEAGTPAHLVAKVAMMVARAEAAQEAVENRRASDRKRQQEKRDRDNNNVMSRDTADVTDKKEKSPPKDIYSNPPEKKNSPLSPNGDIPPADCQAVVSVWTCMASRHGRAQCAKLTEKRRKLCQARLRTDGMAEIQRAIDRIPDSPFLLGSDGGWRADFDFILKPDSVTKILEGKYDGTIGGSAGRGSGFHDKPSGWLG